ncbi:phycobilisome linker polypeptide [Tumidithrix helvetica PCC 7403]|uniref:Phycobilisome linker polypeptide n=1 Tax=Tumidithrix elongata BACA0141 TaxID=2716417 RepID=A0AAW9Q3F8_9CYAN|nr:phycobilisome linker polypeptide [Tumidithrix elongata RA019]
MISSTSTADNRIFVYEVTGLRQNQQTENNNFQIRNSGSVFVNVPYNRMNEQMQSITRAGGTIVSIRPLSEHLAANA